MTGNPEKYTLLPLIHVKFSLFNSIHKYTYVLYVLHELQPVQSVLSGIYTIKPKRHYCFLVK